MFWALGIFWRNGKRKTGIWGIDNASGWRLG
jgi:hypothetical protein